MLNEFEKVYSEFVALKNKYNAASKVKDAKSAEQYKKEMEDINKYFAEQPEEEECIWEALVNGRECHSQYLVFRRIPKYVVDDLCKMLKKEGIQYFIYSAEISKAFEISLAIQSNGFRLMEMVELKDKQGRKQIGVLFQKQD